MEEAECRAEGVACPVLEFADNTAVASLLEERPHGLTHNPHLNPHLNP